jgi:uncharacterized protein (DUF885 family)
MAEFRRLAPCPTGRRGLASIEGGATMADRRQFLAAAAAAVLLTARGRTEAVDPDARFYALLDTLKDADIADETPAGAAAARARQVAHLSALRGFDPAPLSFEARLDYDGVLQGLGLEAILRGRFPFGTTGAGVSPYVISLRSGTWLTIGGIAKNGPPEFLSALAATIGGETARIEADAAAGVVPPDFILDATLTKIAAARDLAPAPLSAALTAQYALLKGLRDGATHDAGVWRLPDGDAYYALALKIGTSLDVAPDVAHARGLDQVRELSARADVLLRKQGLKDGSVGKRLHLLSLDKRYLYADDDAGRTRAVAKMNAHLALVRPLLAKAFAGLSTGIITVQRAGPGRIGYREAPSYDGASPGAYYVDLRDIERRPSWSLPTVVHHETLPGHLLQLPLQERAKPPVLRLRYAPNAFFEGWAIYAEQLADELGLFNDDDLARLGFLQSLLVRAGRLVIDTGIHWKRWRREEAIARFFDIAGDAPDTFENEVDRIVVQPGLTAGPALGRATILDLREAARGRSGFNPIAFHGSILKRGSLRLALLQRAVAADSHI